LELLVLLDFSHLRHEEADLLAVEFGNRGNAVDATRIIFRFARPNATSGHSFTFFCCLSAASVMVITNRSERCDTASGERQ